MTGRCILLLSSLLLSSLALGACKDKSEELSKALTGGESEKVEPIEKIEEPPSVPDAQQVAKLTETPQSIFEAAKATTQPLRWEISGEQITFRAEATKIESEVTAYDLKVFVQIKGSEETMFFECGSLYAAAQGRSDLVLRGDKVHALCINPPEGKSTGTTNAKRFAFDLGKRTLSESGSYGGNGTLDIDSIDLDEGEEFE